MRAAKNSMEAALRALAAVVDDDRLDLEPGANQGLRLVSVSVSGIGGFWHQMLDTLSGWP
jgi:hypothetical protein